MKPTAVGDRVQYAARWLRSAGIYTGPLPFARGTVIQLEPFGQGGREQLAVVRWDAGTEELPTRILPANLHRIGTPELD